jgi:hypothetical protein
MRTKVMIMVIIVIIVISEKCFENMYAVLR